MALQPEERRLQRQVRHNKKYNKYGETGKNTRSNKWRGNRQSIWKIIQSSDSKGDPILRNKLGGMDRR